jgi:hypothetical protein
MYSSFDISRFFVHPHNDLEWHELNTPTRSKLSFSWLSRWSAAILNHRDIKKESDVLWFEPLAFSRKECREAEKTGALRARPRYYGL